MLVSLRSMYVWVLLPTVQAAYVPKYRRETEHLVAYIYGGLIYWAL